jgi:hypothetical protein
MVPHRAPPGTANALEFRRLGECRLVEQEGLRIERGQKRALAVKNVKSVVVMLNGYGSAGPVLSSSATWEYCVRYPTFLRCTQQRSVLFVTPTSTTSVALDGQTRPGS